MLRHLPNLITVLRMVLVLPLVWLIHEGRYAGALGVAATAGVSDALDGFLAKRCGWQSWLGGVLDPIADKLLLIASFVTLAAVGALPAWLAALVVGRDLLIVAGAIAYHFLIGRFTAAPSVLSKITTAVQILCVLLELVRLSHLVQPAPLLREGLIVLTAALTLASGLHYVLAWSRRAWQVLHARHPESPA